MDTPIILENHPTDSRIKIQSVFQTLSARMGTGGGNVPMIMEPRVFAIGSQGSNGMDSDNPHAGIYEAQTTRTLDLNGGNPSCNQGGMCVVEGNGARPSHKGDGYKESDVMYTLNATEQHAVSYGIERAAFNQGQNAQYGFAVTEESEPTMVARGPRAVAHPTYSTSKANYHAKAAENVSDTLVATDYKDPPTVEAPPDYVVRRLTPLECERLQGFPDRWTLIGEPREKEVADYEVEYDEDFNVISKTKVGSHIETVHYYESDGKMKEVTDSARYKALGNSIALPFWKVLARRIAAQYDRDITIGSLFDGIGGFPLAFEHCGGKALWASEVEEFCIAVTKERFPEGGVEER